jgi:hypothetical protein
LALVNDCIDLRLLDYGRQTPKEKHKKDLQHEAKRETAEHEKQKATEAQHHPTSGHPATAEHPASSGDIEVKEK